jgi:hypothetical protein
MEKAERLWGAKEDILWGLSASGGLSCEEF